MYTDEQRQTLRDIRAAALEEQDDEFVLLADEALAGDKESLRWVLQYAQERGL